MSTLTESADELTHNPRLDFASLTPVNLRAHRGVAKVLDKILSSQPPTLQHHAKFIRSPAGDLLATRSPMLSTGSFSGSSGLTTEADQTDDEVLSLNQGMHPSQPKIGFVFGTGDPDRFPDTGGVDILLPSRKSEDSFSSSAGGKVYPRQGFFAFGSSEHPQLWLHARHKGIRVNDQPLAPRCNILLPNRARISIGAYRYVFEFKVADEQIFRAARREYLAVHYGDGEAFEATSATPSSSDIRVQEWVLHGIIGASLVANIHAATHVRTGETAAVKRLNFGRQGGAAENEVQIYSAITSRVQGHKYGKYVMQKHSPLSGNRAEPAVYEAYLLWTPLARGDFTRFGISFEWYSQSPTTKKTMFVQILLGLKALHDSGWMHRDLKPANLGVVNLGSRPWAVIIDEGQAIPITLQKHHTRLASSLFLSTQSKSDPSSEP